MKWLFKFENLISIILKYVENLINSGVKIITSLKINNKINNSPVSCAVFVTSTAQYTILGWSRDRLLKKVPDSTSLSIQ